jgi:hypothetical protein
MFFRTTLVLALLTITPALATLDERNVDEPYELEARSEMEDDGLMARDLGEQEELERRFFGFLVGYSHYIVCQIADINFDQAKLAIKGAVKAGKAAAHHKHHKHHKRDLVDEELFERDLDFDELLERDFEPVEELAERDFENLEDLD